MSNAPKNTTGRSGGCPRFPLPSPTEQILWKKGIERQEFFAKYHNQRNGRSSGLEGQYDSGPLDGYHRSDVQEAKREVQIASKDAICRGGDVAARRLPCVATWNETYGVGETSANSLLPTVSNGVTRGLAGGWNGRRRWDLGDRGHAPVTGNTVADAPVTTTDRSGAGRAWFGRRKWTESND